MRSRSSHCWRLGGDPGSRPVIADVAPDEHGHRQGKAGPGLGRLSDVGDDPLGVMVEVSGQAAGWSRWRISGGLVHQPFVSLPHGRLGAAGRLVALLDAAVLRTPAPIESGQRKHCLSMTGG
jgi:hypothetical protein